MFPPEKNADILSTNYFDDYAVENYSMFVCKEANTWMAEAAKRPNPISLWYNLWFEGELCCLFADTNVGKSIYAIQIARHISRKHKVLYFDFEMSDKQFQMRYTDENTGQQFQFPDKFYRVEFNRGNSDIENLEAVIAQIRKTAVDAGAKVLIIDNISWLCNSQESGDAAGILMQLLIEIKREHNFSILVLAHTPKRNTQTVLTQNSLAGSKRLANFMDSIFAIGVDHTDMPRGRYIKQIKVRSAEMQYGENNVITATLEKNGNYIALQHTGYACERDLLDNTEAPKGSDITDAEIIGLIKEGKSCRQIQAELHVSPKRIVAISRSLK